MKTEEMQCPVCKAKINGLIAVEKQNKPKKGDLSICISCGTINQFDEEFKIVMLPDSILKELKEHHPDVIKLSNEIKENGKKYR